MFSLRCTTPFFLTILCLIPTPGRCHGDETTITTLYPSLSESILDASTYLHPIQAEYILREFYGKNWRGVPDFFRFQPELFSYIEQHLRLKNNERDCAFFANDIPLKNELELVADGLQLNYSWVCSEPLNTIHLTNSLLIKDIPDQINIVHYLPSSNATTSPLYETILNKDKQEEFLQLTSLSHSPSQENKQHRDTTSKAFVEKIFQWVLGFVQTILNILLP